MEAVSAITPLKKITSDTKNHQSKQNSSNDSSRLFFSKVLDVACEREKESRKDINLCINGYTKDALPFYQYVNMREYCQ